jgi:hypothetical protein
MNFLKALASGRPMRREMPSDSNEWIALGYEGPNDVVGTPRWREVRSGKAIGLHRFDYEATDWEICP